MNWPMAPLSQLCEMDRQGVRPDDPDAARLPFLGVENVEAESGVIDLNSNARVGSQKSTSFRFDDRHVLYGKLRPYLNKVAIPAFAGKCSTELIPLLPREGVDREFLGHLLRRRKTVDLAMSSVTGSRMPRTDMKVLLSLPVPRPPLDDQRRIVGILNRSAKIERLRSEAQDRLREFIPALFIKMFGDPVENPNRWVTEQLGNLITEGPQNGLYRPKSTYGSGIPILRINGFYDGNVSNPDGWLRLSLDAATVKKYALAENDVVINRVNSRPFLGKSAMIPKIEEPAVFESNMMRIRLDSNRIDPRFLVSMLQLESMRLRLSLNAKDAINQSSINQTDVCKLLVIAPPLDLQRVYTHILETVRGMASFGEASSKTASKLSASLMSCLLKAGATFQNGKARCLGAQKEQP